MSGCSHYLELPTGVPDSSPQIFDCEIPLDHKGKHKSWAYGVAVGLRPRGGKARKSVQVWIEWDR